MFSAAFLRMCITLWLLHEQFKKSCTCSYSADGLVYNSINFSANVVQYLIKNILFGWHSWTQKYIKENKNANTDQENSISK